MAENVFTKILTSGDKAGYSPLSSTKATNWFRNQAQGASASGSGVIRQLGAQATGGIEIGKMYLFKYDPKLKSDLPYYDSYPLIFPFDNAPGGFYGINFHYLPMVYRAKLMDALISLADSKTDRATRLKLSYQILKSSSKFRYFKPCVKHYLNKHVKSRFINIDSSQWDIALFLPLQRFNKASAATVYRDSTGKF